MKFHEIYQYVFESRAVIKVDSKLNADEKQKAEARKTLEIRNAFDFLKLDIIENNALRRSFLEVLISLNTSSSNALKEVLYGDETLALSSDELESVRQGYNDDQIRRMFRAQNAEYNFFSEDNLVQAENAFIVFFKACKLNGDFIECNNDKDNSLAIDLAYKMLVIFGTPKNDDQSFFKIAVDYLKENGKGVKPVHDALVQTLPKNVPPINDLSGWRNFIFENGYKGLGYFQLASDIEKKLDAKAPRDVKQAEFVVSQLTYARASEYPKLAYLCKKYNINEDIFNKCLDIELTKKKSDQLPDIVINGKEVDASCDGYYLAKLPIDDPRAYILGKITNCCQSIGDHSELCVIDGINREKNGFYVLLKKNKKVSAPPSSTLKYKEDVTLNYFDGYEIVGQGYAWLSVANNLVFDSWENLRPEVDNKVIVLLLKEFSKKVVEKEDNIMRVSIGRGGKTPAEFSSEISMPDIISEGYQYGDSIRQSLLYFDKEKFLNMLKSLLNASSDASQVCENNPVWIEMLAWLPRNLINNKNLQQLAGKDQYAQVIAGVFAKMCRVDHQLLNDENWASILSVPQYAKTMGDALISLNKAKPDLVNDENRAWLATNIQYADEIADALAYMYKCNPDLVNDENRAWLAANPEDANNIANALSYTMLRCYPPLFVTDKLLALFKNNAQYAREISTGIFELHDANAALVNDENIACLIAKPEFADHIGKALADMYSANPALINDANRAWFIENAENAEAIQEALFSMRRNGDKLLNDVNWTYLRSNVEYVETLGYALASMYEGDPALVNDANRAWLLKNPKNAGMLGGSLAVMYQVDPELVNDENRTWLLENAQYARAIMFALKELCRVNPALVSNKIWRLLVNNIECVGGISKVLVILYKTSPSLVNDERLAWLMANPHYAEGVGFELDDLYKVDPLLVNEANCTWLMTNAQHVRGLGYLLSELHKINPDLVNDTNRAWVETNVKYVPDIIFVVRNMRHHYPVLANDKNWGLLASNVEYIRLAWNGLQSIYRECEETIKALGAGAYQQGLVSSRELKLPLEKLKKYLCGDATVSFDRKELDVLQKWKLDEKSFKVITVEALSKPLEMKGLKHSMKQ